MSEEPSKRPRTSLPPDIVRQLNDLGLGGRNIYVPRRKTSGGTMRQISASMFDTLKRDQVIDLEDYEGLETSGRTLRRARDLAMQQYRAWKKQQEMIGSDGHGGSDPETEHVLREEALPAIGLKRS